MTRPASRDDAQSERIEPRPGEASLRFWRWERGDRILAAILLVAVLLAYLPVFRAGFIWDDDDYLQNNALVQQAAGLAKIWLSPLESPQYYPLVFTSFWLEYRLFGLNPFPYHLDNVLLHGLDAVLVWLLLRRLRVPGAWWAGLVFAVHPVHVESVAWVTERKNVLSTLLYLLSAWSFLDFEDGALARERRRSWWASFGLFAGALLAKTVTASLPAALVLVRLWRRRTVDARYLLRLAPLFAAGIALGLNTARLEFAGATRGDEFAIPFADRLLIASRAVFFYAGKLAWPHPLVFFYPRWEISSQRLGDWVPVAAAVVVVAVLLVAWRRWGMRGPALAAAFFAGTLFPALGFIDVYPFRYSFVADHFQYLASIGLIALACAGVARCAPRHPRALTALGSLVAAVLGALNFAQAMQYRDAETLWQATLRRNPGAWNVHVELGNLRIAQGDLQGALGEFREADRLAPEHQEGGYDAASTLGLLADEVSGRAEDLDARGDAAGASRERAKAAQLLEECEAGYRRVLALHPRHASSHRNLSLRLWHAGRLDEAIALSRRGAELAPGDFRPRADLGAMLMQRGDLDEAVGELRVAVALSNGERGQRLLLAKALAARRGADDEAITICRALVAEEPRDVEPREELAQLLARTGRRPEAEDLLRRGLLLSPGNDLLQRALAQIEGGR